MQPTICSERGNGLLRFGLRELNAGRPVIVGWRQRHPVKWLAALVVGIEGRQNRQAFEPHALLLLDPAGDAPALAGFNARLERHGNDQIRYRSPAATRAVTVQRAVSIRPLVNATASV